MPSVCKALLVCALLCAAASVAEGVGVRARARHAPRLLGGGGGGGSNNTPLSPEDEVYLRNSKIILLCVVGFGTLLVSWSPWFLIRVFKARVFDVVNVLSATAAGVILGALLSHTLPEVGTTFKEYLAVEYGADAHIAEYPFGPLIIGGVFILLTFVDRVVITKGLHGHSHGEHGHSHGRGSAHAHDHVHGSAPPMMPAAVAAASAAAPQPQHHHISHDHVSEGMRALMAASGDAVKARGGVADAVALTVASASAPAEAAAEAARGSAEGADASSEGEGAATEATALAPAAGAESAAKPAPACADETSVISVILKRETAARAWVYVLALSLHAFFDGLSLGAERTVEGFYSILIAVAAHKAFDGLAVGAAVFPAGFSRTKSLLLLALAAFMTPLGVIVGLVATESVDGPSTKLAESIIVSLTGGSFLFISLSELLPSSLHDGRWVAAKLGGFTLGWAGMVVLAAFV